MWQVPEEDPDRLQTTAVRPARLAIGSAAITVAIVLAVVLVGQSQVLSVNFPRHSASQPATAPPIPGAMPAPNAATVRFDPATRKFLMDGLEGTLPPAWFMRDEGFFNIGTPGVGGCFGNACDPNNVGPHPLEGNIPWGAVFEAVQVEDPLTGKDISETADKILSYWSQYTVFYTDVSGTVTVQNERKQTMTTNLPRPARMITAELHYHKPGLKIRYDHFYLLVVKGSLGQYTAFVAAWSDNATADAATTIQDSINSLQVV